MGRILITGTLAFDEIGAFTTPLTPDTRNVKLDRLLQTFGGCAMNIAYNLARCGHRAVPFVYAGDDYAPHYRRHVQQAGISEAAIQHVAGTLCARAIILTGSDGAQLTAFYPGPHSAACYAHDLAAWLPGRVFDAIVIAPDLPANMRSSARLLTDAAIRVWCPGQYAELLSRDDIVPLLDATNLLVTNRHEWNALCSRIAVQEMLGRVGRVLVTDGAAPVRVLPQDVAIGVPPAPREGAHDPTGCGDAFVAGTVSAMLAGATLEQAAWVGNRQAARCLQHPGAQQHDT